MESCGPEGGAMTSFLSRRASEPWAPFAQRGIDSPCVAARQMIVVISKRTVSFNTDIVFRKQADLPAICGNLTRTAIHTVKPDNIATFPGKKLSPQFEGEMPGAFWARFNVRIEGTRIKHTIGPVSLRLYEKFGLVLRIETTVNDPAFFKHCREVEHRDGSRGTQWAPLQKSIYSLPALRELPAASNRRYLEFLSAIEDPRSGRDRLDKLSQPVEREGRRCSGFNLFDPDDENLLCSIVRGEFNISGLQNKTLRRPLPELNSGQMSRLLTRPFQGTLYGADAASGLDCNRLVRGEALPGTWVVIRKEQGFVYPHPAIRNAA